MYEVKFKSINEIASHTSFIIETKKMHLIYQKFSINMKIIQASPRKF